LAARGFSRRTIQAANEAMISPCPRSPNIIPNRNGNVIIVYGAGKQASCVRSLYYLSGHFLSTHLLYLPLKNKMQSALFWGQCHHMSLMDFVVSPPICG
jgi:hypothetical protein